MDMIQRESLMLLFFLFVGLIAKGQEFKEVPIPVELTVGNNRLGLQTIINKYFPESKKFSFFSVTNLERQQKSETNNSDFINNSQISFNLKKGFGISAGINITKFSGFAPTIGVQYVLSNAKWLLILTPNYIFSVDRNFSLLTLLEFKPKISNRLKMYSRFQSFYNQNIKSATHERSYMQLRLGLDYKKYQSGLAANLDYFGTTKIFKSNYGVFIRTTI